MSNFATATYIVVAAAGLANIIFSFWVIIGGWFDLMDLFRDLKAEIVDPTDDGRVD